MSRFIRVSMALVFAVSSLTVSAKDFPTDEQLMSVCVAVAKDDVTAFNAAVKDMTSVVLQVKEQDVMNYLLNPRNFECNGADLKQFASDRQAVNVAKRLDMGQPEAFVRVAKTES